MAEERSPLVPRLEGYARDSVEARRRWVEERTGTTLPLVGAHALDSEQMRGKIENAIGAVQMPLGVAGPLLVLGEHASGTFYVPLATTEGALVRSYERGMVALTRAGGVQARIWLDENRVAPVFVLADVGEAREFAREVLAAVDAIRAEAESTTRHGRLLRLECHPIGREVIVDFRYHTADAQGMNMAVNATDKACRWILAHSRAREYHIFSGYDSEKRASGALFVGGKGKRVTAGARLPAATVRAYLHATPQQVAAMWRRTLLGHVQAAAFGYNGHYANGLTALFIACGQDVANVANSAVGITSFEVEPDGGLYASVTLHALSVATVGGGTGLGTSRECLAMLGCAGADAEGGAAKLAEIAAATLLAGELSMGAAIAAGELAAAHEAYGRNRPDPEP
ncbi:MAG TPA: hydroxymethylglutaryl-CoA reductase [Thermoanaerobaculia bacterium]|jgi:hydroxymethylglutaryl-CoA reductase (NADPH)|nr:hydroxymethylglutaryl-CoA reductase [Thermoanaerobaculia bacterium]